VSILCGVVGATFAIGGAFPAVAATASPGLLGVQDLPGSFQPPSAPTTYTSFNTNVVDPKTCNETPTDIVGMSGAVSVYFARTSGATSSPALFESVISFPNAKTAKAAMTLQAKSAAAGTKCGTVGFVPPGTTAPLGTVRLGQVKFPKVGATSFALGTTPTGGSTLTTVTFLHGPYVVTISAPGTADAPSSTDLKTIVARAEKRLGS
jgi:hypothetical protein